MSNLAVDFGAKFVDFVAWDKTELRIKKRLKTGDMATDLMAGLEALELDAAKLIELRIVNTAPLNELLARTPAAVALLTTHGFADTLRLGRQNRAALYDPVARSPAPAFLVAPQDTHEIAGRLDATGRELTPLDTNDIDAAIASLRDRNITSVAICLLFSHVNPTHELQLGDAIQQALPHISVHLSHQVDPGPREYERTVSVVADAWIAARMDASVHALQAALDARGFTGKLLFGDGRGVLVSDQAARNHRAILLSGAPAAAARAAANLPADGPLIAADIGSLSADMSTARAGHPVMAEAGFLAGVPLREVCTDIESVALGGARRVTQEPRGLNFTSTDPQAPRLDDALAALGRLPIENAWTAPFTPDETVTAASNYMAYALTRYATRRNIDPSRATLAIMGGNGALLAADIAMAMGMSRVRLPRAPGAAAAIGLMQAPQRSEASARIDRPLAELTGTVLGPILDQLEAGLPHKTALMYSVTLAARKQMHPVQLRLAARPASGDQITQAFTADFIAEFGISPPGAGYLFSLSVHHDTVGCVPPISVLPDVAQTGLIATEAGAIWCPADWTLRFDDAAYILERNPS
jgi:N-methylhydantoinase A